MPKITRRHWLIALPLIVLSLVGLAVFLAWGQDLKSRMALISVGMSRKQVEDILGPPALVLDRSGGRGTALAWVDQLWQVDVLTGPDNRVQSIGCKPSQSFVRGSVQRFNSLFK